MKRIMLWFAIFLLLFLVFQEYAARNIPKGHRKTSVGQRYTFSSRVKDFMNGRMLIDYFVDESIVKRIKLSDKEQSLDMLSKGILQQTAKKLMAEKEAKLRAYDFDKLVRTIRLMSIGNCAETKIVNGKTFIIACNVTKNSDLLFKINPGEAIDELEVEIEAKYGSDDDYQVLYSSFRIRKGEDVKDFSDSQSISGIDKILYQLVSNEVKKIKTYDFDTLLKMFGEKEENIEIEGGNFTLSSRIHKCSKILYQIKPKEQIDEVEVDLGVMCTSCAKNDGIGYWPSKSFIIKRK